MTIKIEPFKHRPGAEKNSFRVMIDGQHRATFSPMIYRRGFELYDADHQAIRVRQNYKARHLGEHVDTKAEFEATISAALDAGLIPTIDQLRQNRNERNARKFLEEVARALHHFSAHLAQHAGSLFMELQDVVDAVSRLHHGSSIVDGHLNSARALLSMVRTDAQERPAQEW